MTIRWAALAVLALGCAPAERDSAESTGAGARRGAGGEFSAGGGSNLFGTGGGNVGFAIGDASTKPGEELDPDAACDAVEQRAEKTVGGRADVIMAVDSSCSMAEENAAVQTNLNRFSSFIINAGIDVHVVLVAGDNDGGWQQIAGLFGGGGGGQAGICIDPPLGLPGACPGGDDTNLPIYMHWREPVGSRDALQKLQSTYGGWSGMLRPDAFKTFVVVTDDEATPPDPVGFTNWVNSLPEFQGGPWRFSGIFCATGGANCANVGTTYTALTSQTQGIVGDLASFAAGAVDAQFQAVFDQLADLVVQQAKPVDCEWRIPDPPAGETFDKNAVNVRFTDGTGTRAVLYSLDNESECDPSTGGWYYDDAQHPTRVLACPSSCSVMQADLSGRVEVLFGCARERPPIQ